MNPTLCTIVFFSLQATVLLAQSDSENSITTQDKSNPQPMSVMGFLDGLPMDVVEKFVDLQLNRTIPKKERDSRMQEWAKENNKKKQFDDFMKKINKDEKKFFKKQSNKIGKDLNKQLNKIYNNSKLSYKDVCLEMSSLAEKMSEKVRFIGENSKSQSPCSTDTKQWPEDKIIHD